MGVIANQCRNTGVAIPQKFPRTNRKLARAAIGRLRRLSKNHVIARQCAHCRGNPPNFQTF